MLMAANAVSKILGAVLKIPLTYILHEEGMAVYNTAFGVYVMVLSFVISGIPFAVTKISAGEVARRDWCGAKATVSVAAWVLMGIGAVGTAVMWIGADFFALAMREPRAGTAIRAVAPSVFFVGLGDAVKSGFQGENNMLPTAVSQCIEAAIKLLAGYVLAVTLIGFGTDISAAGAIGGVTVGEIVATAILVVWYAVSKRHIRAERGCCGKRLRALVECAYPLLFMSVTGSALAVVDTSLIRANLLNAGFTADAARKLYGAYTGYAMTVLNLPSGFLATLGVSAIPVIAGAAAVGDFRKIRSVSRRGLVLAAVCGACATGFVAVCGEWILRILFGNVNSAAMLRVNAPAILFICVMQLSSAILQALGRSGYVFASSVTVGVIKVLAAVFLVRVPQINIYGAAIGSDIAYFVGMVMNLAFLTSSIRLKPNPTLAIRAEI